MNSYDENVLFMEKVDRILSRTLANMVRLKLIHRNDYDSLYDQLFTMLSDNHYSNTQMENTIVKYVSTYITTKIYKTESRLNNISFTKFNNLYLIMVTEYLNFKPNRIINVTGLDKNEFIKYLKFLKDKNLV